MTTGGSLVTRYMYMSGDAVSQTQKRGIVNVNRRDIHVNSLLTLRFGTELTFCHNPSWHQRKWHERSADARRPSTRSTGLSPTAAGSTGSPIHSHRGPAWTPRGGGQVRRSSTAPGMGRCATWGSARRDGHEATTRWHCVAASRSLSSQSLSFSVGFFQWI